MPSAKSSSRLRAQHLAERQPHRPAGGVVAGVADAEVGARPGLQPVDAGEAVHREEVGLVELRQAAVLVRDVLLVGEHAGIDQLDDRLDHMVGRRGMLDHRPAQLDRGRRLGLDLEAVGDVGILPDLVGIDQRRGGRVGEHAVGQRPVAGPVDARRRRGTCCCRCRAGSPSELTLIPRRPPTPGVSISRR